jgi:hypothetical protein
MQSRLEETLMCLVCRFEVAGRTLEVRRKNQGLHVFVGIAVGDGRGTGV